MCMIVLFCFVLFFNMFFVAFFKLGRYMVRYPLPSLTEKLDLPFSVYIVKIFFASLYFELLREIMGGKKGRGRDDRVLSQGHEYF